jgi:hypothetical protein
MSMNNQNTYQEGRIYEARIIDQDVCTSTDRMQVILTICIQAALRDDPTPEASTEECPEGEREVWITLDPNDQDRLRMALNNLERLGFHDEDINRLHPEHEHCFSLIGRVIHVRMKVKDGFEYWNLASPKARRVPVGALSKVTDPIKEKIGALKRKPNKSSSSRRPSSPEQTSANS